MVSLPESHCEQTRGGNNALLEQALAHLSPSPSSPPNIPVDIARFDVRFKWAQKVPSHPTRAAHFTRPRYQEWKDSEERLSRIKVRKSWGRWWFYGC